MKKTKVIEFSFIPPSSMLHAGLTPIVAAYLNGTLKKLPKDLSWEEFAYIWTLQKEKFEQTSYFCKRKMDECARVANRQAIDNELVRKAKTIIGENEMLKELFERMLPIREAFELCENFWNARWLFDKRESEIGPALKIELIQKLIDLSLQEESDKGVCIALKSIVGNDERFKSQIDLILDIHLRNNPDDYDNSLKHLSKRAIQNYVSVLKEKILKDDKGSLRSIFYSTLDAYKVTKDSRFTQILVDIIEKDISLNKDKNNTEYFWGCIKNILEDTLVDLKGADLLPVLHALSTNHSLRNYGYFIDDCLSFIDKFAVNEPMVIKILDSFLAYHSNIDASEYNFNAKRIGHLWEHDRAGAWIELYVAHMKRWKHKNISETLNLYIKTQDERLMTTLCDYIIKEIDFCDKELINLLEWEEKRGESRFKNMLLDSKRLEAIWEKTKSRPCPDEDFIRLLKFFQK
jgi:hypothetical protein